MGFVRTGTRTVKITDNVGHTSLVAHHSSQVDGLLRVVLAQDCDEISLSFQRGCWATHLGERLDLSAVAGSPLSGQETKRAMTGGFVLCGWTTIQTTWKFFCSDCTDLTVTVKAASVNHRIVKEAAALTSS